MVGDIFEWKLVFDGLGFWGLWEKFNIEGCLKVSLYIGIDMKLVNGII